MKKILLLSLVLTTYSLMAKDVVFEDYFVDKTMRVDYFHNGMANEEHFSVDRILSDGEWAGSPTKLIDILEYGLYFFEIQDIESGSVIYSRGFASVFGEWQSIPEAQEKWGTFHESVRFPWPKETVNLVMKKRNAKNDFETIWETQIDPHSRAVNPADFAENFQS